MLIKYFAFLWVCGNVFCQLSPENVTEVLLKYEGYIKSAQDLDKSDKQLLKTWASLEQVQLVNLTSHYRLEMSRHKENSFGRVSTNPSWHECLTLHEKEIKKLERKYYSCEADCLTVASGANHAEKQAVHQIGKEIRKWRKSYRYLANQCHDDNPRSDDAAGLCLVEYVQRDRYDLTIQRLISLKQKSVADLYTKMAYTLHTLEYSLKACLSQYLENVRNTMDILNVCYNIKNKMLTT